MKKYFIWTCVLTALIGCGQEETRLEKYTEARSMMGTFVQIDVCFEKNQKSGLANAYRQVWSRLENIAWRMNVYDEKSDVAKINNSQMQPVALPNDTFAVIKKSKYFSDLTMGAFDITVRPLIRMWKDAEESNSVPQSSLVVRMLERVGSDKIKIMDQETIQLTHQDMVLDLGGIAKGYAIDEAARILRSKGIYNFYIDAGGDIYVGGVNCNFIPWRIGIRDPRNKKKILDVISLTNASVATSGSYEQYFEIEGKRYSHIINPISGYPQTQIMSSTVIAKSAMDADALATALSILEPGIGTTIMDYLGDGYESMVFVRESGDKFVTKESKEFKKYRLP